MLKSPSFIVYLYYNIFIILCKAYYALVTVKVPEAVNLASLSPPGCVEPVNAQQGLPANATAGIVTDIYLARIPNSV